jgi:chromosomal replication initiator protein
MDLWVRVLSALGQRVNKQCFDTWFRPILCTACDGRVLRLTVPTEDFRRSLLESYSDVLTETVRDIAGPRVGVEIAAQPERRPTALPPAEVQESGNGSAASENWLPLNPRYTFPSFVIGPSNQFAQAAARAVAERPSRAYNPLYMYGGVGLGKTHLMHAIGHQIQAHNRSLRLAYMSSERFMNELISSIRFNRTNRFREKYRTIDVLMMDDIQFLAGKEATQEEFFHTFNTLYDEQKQIVITSDCPPKDLPNIEERLHSRFEWGLIADIQPPNLETKIAILKKKAEANLMFLSDDVMMYVAGGIRSNVRELEGALTRLAARSSLDGIESCDIDVGYAHEVLKDIVGDERRSVSSEPIIRAVAAHFGLKPAQLKTKNNSRQIAEPRQYAMYVCKQETSLSLPQIGKDFGGKHHTTVLHSIRKIEGLKKKNPEVAATIEKIIKAIR